MEDAFGQGPRTSYLFKFAGTVKPSKAERNAARREAQKGKRKAARKAARKARRA